MAVRRQLQRLANVAQQHVGPLHLAQRSAVGLGDRFFHQTFFQADAQIASHDLDDVLGFEGRGLREQLSRQGGFRGRASGGRDLAEFGGDVWQTQRCTAGLCPAWTGEGARPHVGCDAGWWENGFRDVAKVAELAVGCGQFGFALSGKLRDDLATAPCRPLAAWLPPRRETVSPREIRRRRRPPPAFAP